MVELPRPGLPGKSPKLKTPFPPAGKSPVQAPPALLAAKQRVKGLLGKLGGKGAAGSSSLLERYLETLLQKGLVELSRSGPATRSTANEPRPLS